MASSLQKLRIPDPLQVSGSNIADKWKRFKEPYTNYKIASYLSEASQQKCAAVFLTCIGNDAYDIYRAMEFAYAVSAAAARNAVTTECTSSSLTDSNTLYQSQPVYFYSQFHLTF